jgi:hypothetical protein
MDNVQYDHRVLNQPMPQTYGELIESMLLLTLSLVRKPGCLRKSCPCVQLIKHQAVKTYGGVDIQNHSDV